MAYALQIRKGNRSLGAAFLIHRHWAVTANHCVKKVDDPEEIDLVSIDDAFSIRGRVEERDLPHDLAIIEVIGSTAGRTIPSFGSANEDACWRSPYRPSQKDALLKGVVENPEVSFLCVGGENVRAMQLSTTARFTDFSGYSGSPIETYEKYEPEPKNMSVIGVLIEQHPDRGDPKNASNILWAATIGEIVRYFGPIFDRSFDALLATSGEKQAADSNASIATRTEEVVRGISEVYSTLDRLSQDSNLPPQALSVARAMIPKVMVESAFGGENFDRDSTAEDF